jgi:glycosyltransferase involved in cell wall biosynthesis
MPRVSMIVWNEFRNDARVLKEAESLQAAGYEVTVFALHTPGVTKKYETLESGIKVRRVARSPLWRLRARRASTSGADNTFSDGVPDHIGLPRQLARVVLRAWTHGELMIRMVVSRPRIIHAHDVNTLLSAWIAAGLTRAPLVYDAHEISTDREGYASFRNIVGWLEKRLMPRAAATITTTDARAAFFARAYGIDRPVVLQNRPRFSAAARTDRIRSELGLREAWPIVLYQGGLQKGRGLEMLVEAAAVVENAYFVFLGGGRLTSKLRDMVSKSGLEQRVHFIETVSLSELPSYTASADIGVQPIENTCLNHFTTDSNKLFEYMMGGLPVVASNLPEIRKIVSKYDFGLLVPPGDADALNAAIGELAADKKLRERLARNASAAATLVNWEEQEYKLVGLYRDIVPIYGES